MLVPSILQVRELSATAKSSVSYIANAAREGQPRQGFATCKNFCSDFSQADWQHDCFQTVTLRKSVHVQNVNPGVGNIYLGERFAAFESPVAYMVCILTELNLLAFAREGDFSTVGWFPNPQLLSLQLWNPSHYGLDRSQSVWLSTAKVIPDDSVWY